MTLFGYRVPPAYSLLIWIALWEIIGQLDLAFILPPFSSVIEQLFYLVQRPIFLTAAWQTLQSFFIGMVIAIVGGIAIWIIALDTYAGVRHISPSLDEMGKSFGASRWQLLSKVLFWAALPEILAGVRMGLIRAVKGIVIGQLLVSVVALGRLFRTFSDNFQFEEFWALTLILFVFALTFSSLVGWLEHKVEYYAGSRI